MRAVLESRHWPAPKFRYSPLVAAGPFIKTAGMIGLDSKTGELDGGGCGGEARRILGNLGAVMGEFGLSADHLVSATVYVAGFERFGEVNAAWDDFFSAGAPPARTSVGVSALPLGAAVEMEFLFYAPDIAGPRSGTGCGSCEGCGQCGAQVCSGGQPS